MAAAGYLFYNTNIRVKDINGYHFLGLPDDPVVRGKPTKSLVKERAEAVFELALQKLNIEKMKNLVIVNPSLSKFDLIQACAEVAERYADDVMVVPSLLARMTYALEKLQNLKKPLINEVILVVTITKEFVEFVILRRDQTFELRVASCKSYDPPQCRYMFKRYSDDNEPDSTIFLVHESLEYVAFRLMYEFKPAFCFIKRFQKWDYVLLFGGMCRAMADDADFHPRYHIPNFSSGFETTLKSQEHIVLLPGWSPLPCKIYGYDGEPQNIKLKYFQEHIQYANELVLKKRYATLHQIEATGSSKEILGYIDERGVPYVPAPKHIIESSSLSNLQLPAIKPYIKFLFFDNFYAVEVYQNGYMEILRDSDGNSKASMYLSTVEGTEVGEKAKSHCDKHPRYVIYDVMEVIGKPLNEIKLNPKWGFKLIERDAIVYFQVETSSGTRLIPQELVLAAFMKDMKLRACAYLNSEIKEIEISTNFELTESQNEVFKNAASKIRLEIFSFIVNNVQ